MDAINSIIYNKPKVRSSVSTVQSWGSHDYYKILAIIAAVYVVSFMFWCRVRIFKFFRNLFKSQKENAKDCLIKSIVAGNFIESHKIISKYKIINEKLTSEGYTPLLIAAQYNQTQILKYLIRNGADLKALTTKLENAFYLAVYSRVADMRSRDAGCIHALFHAGIDINLPNALGYTALHLAAYCGHRTLVTWLLTKKARADIEPYPHMLATNQGHYETASLLNQEIYKQNVPQEN